MNIRAEALNAIREHAMRDRPHECCGILIGADEAIVEAVAATNVAAEPTRCYEVSPAEHFAQIKRCRVTAGPQALRIVGVYHSHPHSAPVPSPTDLEQAFEEYVYLIVGPVDGSAPFEIRGYRLVTGTFEELALAIDGARDVRR